MAGKWTGAFDEFPTGSGAVDGFEWNPRTSKAYAEGRGGVIANGHPVGSDASLAWTAGATNSTDLAYRFETAGEGSVRSFYHFDGTSTGTSLNVSFDTTGDWSASLDFRVTTITTNVDLVSLFGEFVIRIRFPQKDIIIINPTSLSFTTLTWVDGTFYNLDISSEGGTVTAILTPEDTGIPVQQQIADAGGTVSSRILNIGSDLQGILSNVELVLGTAQHNYDIDEGAGNTFDDSVGDRDITILVPGSGAWVTL